MSHAERGSECEDGDVAAAEAMSRPFLVPALHDAVDHGHGPFNLGERPVEDGQIVIGERECVVLL
jgi:hypothetical protein